MRIPPPHPYSMSNSYFYPTGMFPSGQHPSYPPQMSAAAAAAMGNPGMLQAALQHQQQLLQQQAAAAAREKQQRGPSSNAARPASSQMPSSSVAGQNSAAAQSSLAAQQQQQIHQAQQNYFAAALQQQLSQQLKQREQANAFAQQLSQLAMMAKPELLSQLQQKHLLLQQQQPGQVQPSPNATTSSSAAASASRPSLISNFSMQSHSPAAQMNANLIKQEPKQQLYGLTAGVPFRSMASAATSQHQQPNSLMRTPEVNASPAPPNRTNNLLSNIHAAQSTAPPSHPHGLPMAVADAPLKSELVNIRDRIEKVDVDHKQIEAQFATINKKKQQLLQQLQQRREEMEKQHKEAEELKAAAAAALAEAKRSKVPLADRILQENRQRIEATTKPPENLLPKTKHAHNLEEIQKTYQRLAPSLIRLMIDGKKRAQEKRDQYLTAYEEKYAAWCRRVEKHEKTPKKIARDQRNRELFEKVFPEMKKEREERERDERHMRNSAELPPKSREEKAAERACHVPMFHRQRPKYTFDNRNNEITEQELRSVNDEIPNFLSNWTPAERNTFTQKIKIYWKQFHVLSDFYLTKTTCDMVKFFYATKQEMKYKLMNPKAKKKIAKTYKPAAIPECREMYDHLMEHYGHKRGFQKVLCLTCSEEHQIFAKVPELTVGKEALRKKLVVEQEYREKMPICNKCYNSYKKVTNRCPVGDCCNGRRRNKPSRALPQEFLDLPVEMQCIIVRKLQFHPATPKICNNCHKRILLEVEMIRSKGFNPSATLLIPPIPPPKHRLKWPADRVDALFRSAADHDKSWETIAAEVARPNFKPTGRQCRRAYAKLANFWRLRRRRLFLEKSGRPLRRTHRRLQRRLNAEHERRLNARRAGGTQAIGEQLKDLALTNGPSDAMKSESGGFAGSLTQGTPLSRMGALALGSPSVQAPLLANFIPTSVTPQQQPASMTSPPTTQAVNQMGIQNQLKDEKWAQYLLEELGLSRDKPPNEHVEIINQRLNSMTPYEFEMLSNRLKARTQQEQEALVIAKFNQLNRSGAHFGEEQKFSADTKAMADFAAALEHQRQLERMMAAGQSAARITQLEAVRAAFNTDASSLLQQQPNRSTPKSFQAEALISGGDLSKQPDQDAQQSAGERPNRKTGLATVNLEKQAGGYRSRSNTLQKGTLGRPTVASASTPDVQQPPQATQHQPPIKVEAADAFDVHQKQSPLVQNRSASDTSNAYRLTQSTLAFGAPPTTTQSATAFAPIAEPVYEEISDDESGTSSGDERKPAPAAVTSMPQKPRWRRLYTIFDLADHERSRIPPCPTFIPMPPLESYDHSAPAYEDLSD